MLVGILSDSHGDADATAKAVALLEQSGAGKLFHCGDVGGMTVLDVLAGHDCLFVWGNCDTPDPTMRRYVADLGLTWPQPAMRVEMAGRHIALYHGHEPGFSAALRKGGLDYLFFGHTHQMCDRQKNGCRLINPGALHRAAIHTVALLNLETDQLDYLCIDTGERIVPADGQMVHPGD